MYRALQARAGPRSQPVSIGVSSQQQNLKKQEAIGPDCGTAAEPGQDVSPHHRLDLEKEKGAKKNGDREMKISPASCPRSGAVLKLDGRFRHGASLTRRHRFGRHDTLGYGGERKTRTG